MPYCCVTDLVTRKLPESKLVKYPLVRERVLAMMAEDQNDRTSGKYWSNDPNKLSSPELAQKLYQRDEQRSRELLEILEKIKTPSVRNIGLDGSRATWLIANHSPSVDITGLVLKKMQRLYRRDRSQVFYAGIPYLVDYLMLRTKNFDHSAKQLYGTRYYYIKYEGGAGAMGSFPIINERNLAARRKKFDLAPEPNYLGRCEHNNGRTSPNAS